MTTVDVRWSAHWRVGASLLARRCRPRGRSQNAPAPRLRLSRRRPAGHDVPGHGRRAVPRRRQRRRTSPAAASQATVVELQQAAERQREIQTACARRLQELQKQPQDAEPRRQEIAEIRQKLADSCGADRTTRCSPRPSRSRSPSTRRRARARGNSGWCTPQGLSNPLRLLRRPAARSSARRQRDHCRRSRRQGAEPASAEPPPRDQPAAAAGVTLPVVNGRIVPHATDAVPRRRATARSCPATSDRYRFQARKGQQLVVAVSARELIPYLADAVPGWFQATLRALRRRRARSWRTTTTTVSTPIRCSTTRSPRTASTSLEIKDAIYRGREDFVYRIAIGELPFVTSIFPLGGPAGAQDHRRTHGLEPAGRPA